MEKHDLILAFLFFIAALLYSSVGHGGASGYLAVMGIVGTETILMKPTALCLNILVSSVALLKFYRVGAFSWKIFIPLAVTAIPFAYLGGGLHLPSHIYKPVVGIILVYAAIMSFKSAKNLTGNQILKPVSNIVLLFTGASLGLLSGLTGVGGGIFLSPLLLLMRWSTPKIIAGVAAAFILVNSVSGLLGLLSTGAKIPNQLSFWLVAAFVGGLIGATYGSKKLGDPILNKLLAVVLVIAGIKMIFNI